MKHRLIWATSLLLLVILLLTETSMAFISYEINAQVGGNAWRLSRSTQNFTLSLDGNIFGSGNFSRYSKIKNIAGIKSDERSSAVRGGYINIDEKKRMETVEGPVTIVVQAASESTNTSIPDPNDPSRNIYIINITEYADINVDEVWPAGYADYRKISYEGPRIRTLERDEHDGDVVLSSSDSYKLEKESLYRTQRNRTFFEALITPTGVVVNQMANRSSFYALNVTSAGSLSHLDIIRQQTPRNPKTRITEDYSGEFNMVLKIKMDEFAYKFIDDEYTWLPCCFAGYSDLTRVEREGFDRAVFDCMCPAPTYLLSK